MGLLISGVPRTARCSSRGIWHGYYNFTNESALVALLAHGEIQPADEEQ